MSKNYTFKSSSSYSKWLREISDNQTAIKYEISSGVRKIIASKARLAKENMQVIEASADHIELEIKLLNI